MSYLNKVITINDNIKYLVIVEVEFENHKYLYIVNEEDEKESRFVEIVDGEIKTIDPTLFQKQIYPLFIEKLSK